mmetsp:Transcript_18542/g.26184  ORF Transcript_18542/g.26184 Transcript_18542/m.26184 type:complete len:219 (+) Transcript_18542:119-775(+)
MIPTPRNSILLLGLSFVVFCVLDTFAFVILPTSTTTTTTRHTYKVISFKNTRTTAAATKNNNDSTAEEDSWNLDDEQMADLFEDYDGYLDGEIEGDFTPLQELDQAEKAWRYAKKPLLSIGGKGAALSHGNSLRQLLNDHTAVKVKVNLRQFGSLKNAFDTIKGLAEEAGAPKGIELIQLREGDRMILFGLPGTLKKIENGEFPPKPVVKTSEEDDDA